MKPPVDSAAPRASASSRSRFEPNRLREGARGDAGFLRDLRERELARSQAIRGAVRGGEDLLVADFPGSWAHWILTFLNGHIV
jgi:hypothetical protein